MNTPIIGREKELEILKEIFESNDPHFLAVYGRRRIGKTFLIHEFFKSKGVFFEISGIKEGSLKEQLFQFSNEFSKKFNDENPITPPKTWGEAFKSLQEAIEKIEDGKKIILFFDEIPWLASRRSKFLNSLEHFWNRHISRNNNAILIICGSSASWIIRNIVNNRGGLHGRLTRKIRLLPFTLSETEKYLQSRYIELDRKQIIDIYMTIGGVPKYLSYLSRGKSAAQNINDTCFNLQGSLYNEFDNLYKSLFDNYQHHIAIVKALAKATDGLSKDELLSKVKLTSGGTSTRIIEDLVNAGFVVYVPSFAKRKSGGIYRLIDEYSLFYLTWMVDNISIGLENIDQNFWMKKQNTAKYNTWSGSAFECLCLKHIQKIKSALGISGISTIESGWRHIPKKGAEEIGAQIDLVIDRSDHCINLCEMKYSNTEFTIDKAYEKNLQNKKNTFREKTETTKSLFTTMVTTYGVNKNSHYFASVENQLTMDDLF